MSWPRWLQNTTDTPLGTKTQEKTPRVYSHKFSFRTYRIHSEWIRISVVVGVVGWVKREFFIVRQDCGSTIKSITPTARLLPIKRRCHSQLDTTRRYWSAVYCASQHIWFNNVDQPRLHMNEVEFLCISDFRWHRRQHRWTARPRKHVYSRWNFVLKLEITWRYFTPPPLA